MRSQKITFTNRRDVTLAGVLDLPPSAPRATALFAHCFSCSSQSHAARRISEALAQHGIATLRFDFTGLGGSGGTFADSHFAANVDDLRDAARYLGETRGAPAILIGHSLGGAAVVAAAADIPAKAVVTIGAPFDPGHALHHIADALDEIERTGEARVTIAQRTFVVGREFVAGSRGHDQHHRLAELKRPLLVLHAPGDTVVGIDNARQIFDAARHPKSFVSLDSADHLLTDRNDAAYVAGLIAAWAGRYLDPPPARGRVEGSVTVRSTDAPFVQDVAAGTHALLADEPEAVGGEDAGPTPYDLLLAALGACTAMTLALFARRENIPLADVAVGLAHERIHAADCESGSGRLERITRRIVLGGPLSDEQRALLLKIADRCPVHRTLEGRPAIVTTEVAAEP